MKKIKRNVVLTPGPATTTDSVKLAQVVSDICPRESEFGNLIYSVTNDLTNIVANPSKYVCIPFGCSGTGAVEAVLSSVIPQNSKVLILNNGAYGERMAKIASCYYRKDQIILYQQTPGSYPDLNEIEEIIKSNDGISHLAMVHHETTTGMLNPSKDIARLARKYCIKVILDAISSFAGIEINQAQEGYNYLIATSNKCLQGMAGISFCICSNEDINLCKYIPPHNLYLNLWNQYYYIKNARQTPFTPPVQTFYALRQAIDEYNSEGGVSAREKRYNKLYGILANGMQSLGFKTFLKDEEQAGMVTTFYEPKDFDFNKVHDKLLDSGYTIYPGKIGSKNTFRVGNIGAITSDDITNFISKLSEILGK